MKRFYKETAVAAGDGGYRVLLDGKPMRTPAKAVLVTPTQALAEAIAAEWRGGPGKAGINVSPLRLTPLPPPPPPPAAPPRARGVEGTAENVRAPPPLHL